MLVFLISNFFTLNFSGIAYEYSDKGITVQCVCPGPVRTDMLDGIFKDEVQDFGAMAPNVDVYTAQAMSTLGFSYHTSGYWKHGIFSLLTSLALAKMGNKRLMMKSLEKEKNA